MEIKKIRFKFLDYDNEDIIEVKKCLLEHMKSKNIKVFDIDCIDERGELIYEKI